MKPSDAGKYFGASLPATIPSERPAVRKGSKRAEKADSTVNRRPEPLAEEKEDFDVGASPALEKQKSFQARRIRSGGPSLNA